MDLSPNSKLFAAACMDRHQAFAILEHLCDEIGPRLAGSDAERRAAEFGVGQLSQHGYEAAVEPFSYEGWQMGPSTVTVTLQGRSHEMASQPLGWSPCAEVDAEVVDVGCGMEADYEGRDVAGKIVLVSAALPAGADVIHRTDKYRFAVGAGAAGFLFYTERAGGLPVMGSLSLAGEMGAIPGSGISYEDALALRRALPQARIAITSTGGPTQVTSHHGVALKRGAIDEEVIVCGHIDSWFCPGATDNGSGSACVIELGRLLAPLELHRSVRFILFGSEEPGLVGSRAWVRERAPAAGEHLPIHAVINLDACGIVNGRPMIKTNDDPLANALMRDIVDTLRVGADVTDANEKYSDHWPFREQGLPSIFVGSTSPSPGWGHTVADTLDKVRPESLTLPLLIAGVAAIECASPASVLR